MLRSLRFVFQQVQTKGFWPTFHRLRMTNFLGVQPGTLKGVDKYGNEYYESAEEAEINGQERWYVRQNFTLPSPGRCRVVVFVLLF